jgi:hypothetical protein
MNVSDELPASAAAVHNAVKNFRRPAKVQGNLGLRRQSGSGDGAFGRATGLRISTRFGRTKSGVALRLPPQSKTRWQKIGLPPGRAELQLKQP